MQQRHMIKVVRGTARKPLREWSVLRHKTHENTQRHNMTQLKSNLPFHLSPRPLFTPQLHDQLLCDITLAACADN